MNRILVTGAARGLGRDVAIQLASRGCRVGIVDVDAAGLDSTAMFCRRVGGDCETIALDLAEDGAPEAAVARMGSAGPASTFSLTTLRFRASSYSPRLAVPLGRRRST